MLGICNNEHRMIPYWASCILIPWDRKSTIPAFPENTSSLVSWSCTSALPGAIEGISLSPNQEYTIKFRHETHPHLFWAQNNPCFESLGLISVVPHAPLSAMILGQTPVIIWLAWNKCFPMWLAAFLLVPISGSVSILMIMPDVNSVTMKNWEHYTHPNEFFPVWMVYIIVQNLALMG